jgi:chromate transporter
MHRTWGGIIAGALFVLPGFVAILLLSWLYVTYNDLPAVAAIFFGLKAAVLAVVVEAVARIGRRALKNHLMVWIAAAAFIAIFVFAVPFPIIVAGAALFGFLGQRLRPRYFPVPADAAQSSDNDYVVDRQLTRGGLAHIAPSVRRSVKVLAVCVALWFVPVLAVILAFGANSVFAQQSALFSKAAVVTFGGAYAVLAYIAQRAVESYEWLSAGEMLDGLALAETTPGPLIMVVQYVAYLGAFRHPEGLSPSAAGLLASVLTTWVTFVPCFLWIFLGAPYVERLRANRGLNAALSSITAAVVGVILNLSVWFAIHTIFRSVNELSAGPVRLDVPRWSSVDPASLILAAAAMIAMLRFKVGMGWTLLASAIAGSVLWWLSNAGA